MPDGFNSLKHVFYTDPSLNKLRKVVKLSDIVNDFEVIFPELRKVAVAVKAEKKTIFLKVENAAWRSELKFREKQIIEKINKHYKEERINYIRFIS